MCISKGTTVRQKYFGTIESPRFLRTKQHGTVVAPAHASDFVSNCAGCDIILNLTEHFERAEDDIPSMRTAH